MTAHKTTETVALSVATCIIALLVLSGCATAVEAPNAVGIRAEGCGPVADIGSGVVVAPDLVLTSAHVVAGAETITVLLEPDTAVDASIVGFDPAMDLAYLRSPGLKTDVTSTPISSEHVVRRAPAHALVFRDGVAANLDVEVKRRVEITTEDIYVEGTTLRPGFELDADIKLGDSGGAVYLDGEIIGILWARSRSFDDNVAYAIDPSRARGLIDQQLATGIIAPEIDLARCP